MSKGRPKAGISKNSVFLYRICLRNWINNYQLAQYLKEPESCREAERHLADLPLRVETPEHEALTDWCEQWLSKDGRARLRANVRQRQHRNRNQGTEKRVAMDRLIANDLYDYAEQHALSVSEAVHALLASASNAKVEIRRDTARKELTFVREQMVKAFDEQLKKLN